MSSGPGLTSELLFPLNLSHQNAKIFQVHVGSVGVMFARASH